MVGLQDKRALRHSALLQSRRDIMGVWCDGDGIRYFGDMAVAEVLLYLTMLKLLWMFVDGMHGGGWREGGGRVGI